MLSFACKSPLEAGGTQTLYRRLPACQRVRVR